MKTAALLAFLYGIVPLADGWKLSSSSVSTLAGHSKTYPKTPPTDIFKIIDANSDGKISLAELQTTSDSGWDDPKASHRARVTLGISHPFQFIQEFDADGDGELSFGEFAVSYTDIPTSPSQEAAQTCASMRSHVDTCKTSDVLRCNSYIDMAQNICHLDHPNVVQHCIMSSPCASMCNCIENAEKAAHGQMSFVLQQADGRQEHVTSLSSQVNSTELGVHRPQKRFFWIFLALAVVEVTNVAVYLALQSQDDIANQMGREVKNLDFEFWRSGPVPQCSAYVFWSSSCGAIGSSSARGCSDGGARLYKNSCKDHFRYGSQACGFAGFGCRSLCYAVNPKGCPCSIVDKWTQQDDIDYPGNDLQSLHVAQISDCRNACASISECLAYVVPPPNGEENQINCFLKSAFGTFKRSDGVTSFLKISPNARTCPTNLGGGAEFGLFDRRGMDILDGFTTLPGASTDLAKRADDRIEKFWPFAPNNNQYLVLAQFLVLLYNQWIGREQLGRMRPAVLTSIGAARLTPGANEPVSSPANPRWRVNEGWRINNVYRGLLNHVANSGSGPAAPVATFMNMQGTTPLANALFPTFIRNLLINNEITIQNNPNGLVWTGARSSEDPYPGVLSAHAGAPGGGTPNNNQLGYYQGGAMGPFSLEAAFILATQLAGINWSTHYAGASRANRPLFWINGVVPQVPRSDFMTDCLPQYVPGHEYSTDARHSRRAGFLHETGSATGDPRAGIYFVIDVDGEVNPDNNRDRNVFVFAMHTMDPNSRINVPNANAINTPSYTQITPGAQHPRVEPNVGVRQQRYFAHAHAAWVPYSSLSSFMNQERDLQPGQTRLAFPGYRQVGSFHLYILSEDTDTWPRNAYVNNDANNPPDREEL